MEEVSTIGLDLAKSVFQVHGIDAAGRVWCAGSCVGERFLGSSRHRSSLGP